MYCLCSNNLLNIRGKARDPIFQKLNKLILVSISKLLRLTRSMGQFDVRHNESKLNTETTTTNL